MESVHEWKEDSQIFTLRAEEVDLVLKGPETTKIEVLCCQD